LFEIIFGHHIWDLIGNNKNSVANCMVYLAKKKVINLRMAHNYSWSMSLKGAMWECILIIKNIKWVVFDCILPIHFMILYNTTDMSHLKVVRCNVLHCVWFRVDDFDVEVH
jgi:hypothetical protein